MRALIQRQYNTLPDTKTAKQLWTQIASDFGLNEYVSQIISGVILFFILGSEFFINYQVKAGGKHK